MKIKAIFLYGVWALFSLALSAACSRMELEPSANGEGGVAVEPEEPEEIISITVGNPWGDDAADAGDNAGAGTGTEPAGGENAGEGQGEPASSGEPGESGDPEAPGEPGESGDPQDSGQPSEPEEPQEPGEADESGELVEDTKISYSYSSSKLKQTWQVDDKLLIYGRTKGDYKVFTCDAVYANGRAHFTGPKPNAANTRFDIVVLGKKSNVSFTNVRDMLNVCFNEMTQTNNNGLSHIESYVWLENVNTYWDIQFNTSWASSHGGGTFYMNPVVHFRIKIPTGSGTPKKIGLVSTDAKRIPHYKGGKKVNSIWLFLNSVTPSSNVFDAWMPLPEGLGAGNYAVSLLMSNNKYYVSPVFAASAMAAGKVHLIQKNMTSYTGYDAHAKLTTHGIKTGGSFNDWASLRILAHPLMETCTLPAYSKYDKLYEARVVGDFAWIYGYMEFTMYGYNQSIPFDMIFASATGAASLLSLGDGGDGLRAFTNTNINRFFEINGLTQPGIVYNETTYNRFNNWRADNELYYFPASYDNRFQWYNATGSGSLYDSLVRYYYSAEAPHQLTVHYVQAAGDYNSSTHVGRLEFRMRRSSLQYNTTNANTSFAFGMKLMGNQNYDTSASTGWYCHGLLPQGGKNASGNRTPISMRVVTVPPYAGDTIDDSHNYNYPYTANEANIVTCSE